MRELVMVVGYRWPCGTAARRYAADAVRIFTSQAASASATAIVGGRGRPEWQTRRRFTATAATVHRRPVVVMVMMVMVTAAGVRGEVVISRCGRLMVMVMMRRGVLVERCGVIDDGRRIRVPLVMRVSDDARGSGGGVHALVSTSTASAADGMRLQPFGRYMQQRRRLWRRRSGGRDRRGRR